VKPGSVLMLCDPWTRYLSEEDVNAVPSYSLMNDLYHVAINSTFWLRNRAWHLEPPAGQLQREAAA
jgi:hypothetical protein